MSAVKQAAYAAKKALRESRKAHGDYLRVKIKQWKRYPLIVARQHGILRSWKKAGKWKAFSHLQRYDKAELEKAVLDIPILEAELHHLRMALFAFDAIQ